MDKRTEKRYIKIKKEQKKLKDEIKKKKEELEVLELEEEEIAGQEIISLCANKRISLIDAIDIFSNNPKANQKKDFENESKENRDYGK